MNVSPRRLIFNRRSENNVYRMFLWAILIVAALWVVSGLGRGNIKYAGQPTETPTRAAQSYSDEGDAHFTAGNLDLAIAAYRKALNLDPNNAVLWAKLAQIQTYSSAMITTDDGRRAALTDALASIDRAKAVAPDDSTVAATRAFVLDWNANPSLFNQDQATANLVEAEQEATRALQLDNTNVLALAYYAEIMVDQQKITQAEQKMVQALEKGKGLIDVHRVYAYLLEAEGLYSQAIEEYDKAIKIAPNMTFFYLRAGANYRQLAFVSTIEEQRAALYGKSLEYFDKAAKINAQLGVKDPIPYLSIAKTYSQLGEFYAAGRNVQKALEFDPANPDVYGQLGIVFQRSRNYEGSIPALECAIKGCDAAKSCEARGGCDPGQTGTAPSTVAYYYTYVSMLAALSRPKANQCPEARRVIAQIRANEVGKDPLVSQIIQENENICDMVDSGRVMPTSTTSPENYTPTPRPGSQNETPTPTPGY
jgi:tetratricopeptide (TPR) repeat protein